MPVFRIVYKIQWELATIRELCRNIKKKRNSKTHF